MPLRPSFRLGLVLLPIFALCLWLGQWQLQRMNQKQALIDRFGQAAQWDLAQAIANNMLFAHVRVEGHYNTKWHLLLDNKILDGRAGVHALSLFVPDRGTPILVNRGWLPLPPDRSSLPEIPTSTGHLSITGILGKPGEGGIRLGDPDHLTHLAGPRLVTYLDLDDVAAATGGKLSPWLIELDADDPSGFAGRDWKPTVMMPAQHLAYAVQWFGLALAIVVLWLVSGWKRSRASAATGDAAWADRRQDDP